MRSFFDFIHKVSLVQSERRERERERERESERERKRDPVMSGSFGNSRLNLLMCSFIVEFYWLIQKIEGYWLCLYFVNLNKSLKCSDLEFSFIIHQKQAWIRWSLGFLSASNSIMLCVYCESGETQPHRTNVWTRLIWTVIPVYFLACL
jgi:hypothetical protein